MNKVDVLLGLQWGYGKYGKYSKYNHSDGYGYGYDFHFDDEDDT